MDAHQPRSAIAVLPAQSRVSANELAERNKGLHIGAYKQIRCH